MSPSQLRPGARVLVHRDGPRTGVIRSEYLPGMYEVRLERGDIVIPADEIVEVLS